MIAISELDAVVGGGISVKISKIVNLANVNQHSIEVEHDGASADVSAFWVVDRVGRIDVFKVSEGKLHGWDTVAITTLDVIDGKIVGDGGSTPVGVDEGKVSLDVERTS